MDAKENAAELRLGEEYENAECLMNSEVKFVLEHRINQHKEKNMDDADLSNVFLNTLKYVRHFSNYNTTKAAEAVREALTDKGLAQFEIAALANLTPQDADEAVKVIPSLSKLEPEELSALLAEVELYGRLDE